MNFKSDINIKEIGSRVGGVLVLLLVVLLVVVFFYAKNLAITNRKAQLDDLNLKANARIVSLKPIQHMSQDFDGNKVTEHGIVVGFEFSQNKQHVRSTDILKYSVYSDSTLKVIHSLRENDSIGIKYSGENPKDAMIDLSPN